MWDHHLDCLRRHFHQLPTIYLLCCKHSRKYEYYTWFHSRLQSNVHYVYISDKHRQCRRVLGRLWDQMKPMLLQVQRQAHPTHKCRNTQYPVRHGLDPHHHSPHRPRPHRNRYKIRGYKPMPLYGGRHATTLTCDLRRHAIVCGQPSRNLSPGGDAGAAVVEYISETIYVRSTLWIQNQSHD